MVEIETIFENKPFSENYAQFSNIKLNFSLYYYCSSAVPIVHTRPILAVRI